MTRKEKLFREYATLNNELVEMTETSNRHYIDIEKSILVRHHNNYTVVELEDLIRYMKSCISHEKSNIKRNNFFATEKGKAIKDKLEYEKKHYEDLIKECFDEYKYVLQKLINKICGERFIVTSFGDSSFEVYYTDGSGKKLFGHDFSIYYNCSKELTLNYPTLGCFNPMTDFNRSAYLEGLAKFSKSENFGQIVDWFHEFRVNLNKYRSELNKIEKHFLNPYELAA